MRSHTAIVGLLLMAAAACGGVPERVDLAVTLPLSQVGDGKRFDGDGGRLVVSTGGRELAAEVARGDRDIRQPAGEGRDELRFVLSDTRLRDHGTGYYSPEATVELRYLTPCGWQRLQLVDFGHLSEEAIRTDLRTLGEVRATVSLPRDLQQQPGSLTLVVDKRGAGPGELRVGELRLPLPDLGVAELHLLAPTCPAPITLDGARLGVLPPLRKLRDTAGPCPPACSLYAPYLDALLDVAGDHCYTYRQVSYGTDSPRTAGAPALLRPARLHRLDRLDSAFLLAPAPESIEVERDLTTRGIGATRNELLSVACPKDLASGIVDQSRARLDHVILGAAHLGSAIEAVTKWTGVRPVYGGKHPGGTHNALLSLGGESYLEILAVQPGTKPPAWLPDLSRFANPAPIGWAIASDDISSVRSSLEGAGFALTPTTPGSRVTATGNTIHWETFGLARELRQAPFFIVWSAGTAHPSATSPAGCRLRELVVGTPDFAALERLQGALQGLGAKLARSTTPSWSLTLGCPRGPVVFTNP